MTAMEVMQDRGIGRACLFSVLKIGARFQHPGDVEFMGTKAPVYVKTDQLGGVREWGHDSIEVMGSETVFPVEEVRRDDSQSSD